MAEESADQASFVDQIVGKTFSELLERKEFDEETLKRLTVLANVNGLGDSASVVKALIGGEEE